jgi:hypothetical protein
VFPAPSSARPGGSGSTPSSAAPPPSLSSTTSPVTPFPSFAPSSPAIPIPWNLVGLNRSVVPGLDAYLGFFASFAALMFNCVKKEDINDNYYSPYDDSEWR